MFLAHNKDLGPPFRILVDTNFINFSIQNKIELVQGMMDCLMAKCESRLHQQGWPSFRSLCRRIADPLKPCSGPRADSF